MKKKVKKKAKKAAKKKKVLKKSKKCKCIKKSKKKKSVKKAKASKSKVSFDTSLEEIGVITHYFPHVKAAVVKLTKGSLSMGDKIIIKGHTTDFKAKVSSMQLDHTSVSNATPGQEIGLGVKKKVRDHDTVYRVVA